MINFSVKIANCPPGSYGPVWYFMWFSMAVQCCMRSYQFQFSCSIFFFLRDDCIQMRENCLCHYMQFDYLKNIQFFFFVYPNPCFILQDVKEQLPIILIWIWSLHKFDSPYHWKIRTLSKDVFFSEKVGVKFYLKVCTYLIYVCNVTIFINAITYD